MDLRICRGCQVTQHLCSWNAGEGQRQADCWVLFIYLFISSLASGWVSVVVWMRLDLHRFISLNSWFPVGETFFFFNSILFVYLPAQHTYEASDFIIDEPPCGFWELNS